MDEENIGLHGNIAEEDSSGVKRKDVKRAAAISYDPEKDAAPVLSAYGEGFVARKIIEKAQESNVPVMFDAGLVQMLSKMNIGLEIPEELYQAVAQILVFLSTADDEYGQRMRYSSQKRTER